MTLSKTDKENSVINELNDDQQESLLFSILSGDKVEELPSLPIEDDLPELVEGE
ncbi:hypothetical protein HDU76_010699, partial [Blyttiomyces sp. JEL0837]